MCLEEGAATNRRKVEDGKTEIIKQKDEMMFFRGRGCEDRSSVATFNCYI